MVPRIIHSWFSLIVTMAFHGGSNRLQSFYHLQAVGPRRRHRFVCFNVPIGKKMNYGEK